jgi:hypothetical protein
MAVNLDQDVSAMHEAHLNKYGTASRVPFAQPTIQRLQRLL